jgi:PIN domain nuclease of toxin-antitoxin system
LRLLLDTHALVWWDNDALPARVVKRIRDADEVYVSAATAWEIAIKSTLGKIEARGTVSQTLLDYGFVELPISIDHAEAVRTLPNQHRDPFDRILVAQARIEGLTLVSRDRALRLYDAPVVWT